MYRRLDEDSPDGELYQLFKAELTLFNTILERSKQEFATLITPELLNVYHWQTPFSEIEKTILTYYKPFATQIQADIHLSARCFSAILKQPVRIKPVGPFLETVEIPTVWIIDKSHFDIAVWGGDKPVKVPCFEVEIGPVATDDIPAFLSCSSLRRFIDYGLCPLFLPRNSRWRIVILPKEEGFNWAAGKPSSFWDINTRFG